MAVISIQVPKPKDCIDCGGEGIFHGLTYFNILIEEFIWSIFPPSGKRSLLKNVMTSIERAVGPAILIGFVKIGLATKQARPDDDTMLLARVLWEEADVRGIEMWEWRLFGLARNVFVAKYPSGKMITFEGIPWPPDGKEHIWWMDDKARMKQEFMKRGLKVARGGPARTESEALNIYLKITSPDSKPDQGETLESDFKVSPWSGSVSPVIVKPASGSGSRHTILHITDEAELLRAFRIAKQVSPKVIVEEELIGPVYRATVVDGEFVAALRRDPPSVVGDGVHTISELVEEENKKPARSGPYFSKIQLDENAKRELEWQGYGIQGETLKLKSVPPKAARVYFHQKVNWSVGGTTVDVTEDVHPDNRALFERAALELTAPIVGIDFIIKDIGMSWKDVDVPCGILECNSMPFFDNHHLPFEGKPHNVAAKIWDMVSPVKHFTK
jgi:D-alanine-D-alanine ligase-like ATP-grasp enzyme